MRERKQKTATKVVPVGVDFLFVVVVVVFLSFFVVLLKDNSLGLEISGKKYPWNPPQPVPIDAITALVVITLGSYFSFPTVCRSEYFPKEERVVDVSQC